MAQQILSNSRENCESLLTRRLEIRKKLLLYTLYHCSWLLLALLISQLHESYSPKGLYKIKTNPCFEKSVDIHVVIVHNISPSTRARTALGVLLILCH